MAVDAGLRMMRRLDQRGPNNRGLAIDADGVELGSRCVLVQRIASGYRCADRAEVTTLVQATNGDEHDAEAIFDALCRITKALTDSEIAFAQIIGLRSPLTALDDENVQRAVGIANLIKANFNPDEPRVPAGSPEGGQWTTDGDAGVDLLTRPRKDREVDGAGVAPTSDGDGDAAVATGPEPQLIDAAYTVGGGESGLRVHLTEAGYTLSSEMWRTVRDLYRLFMAPGSNMAALRDYLWDRGLSLDELPDAIRSLFDAPRPLEELQSTNPPMGFHTEAELRAYLGPPRPGYEWHHLIEQTGSSAPT